jgi:hypothetical protein
VRTQAIKRNGRKRVTLRDFGAGTALFFSSQAAGSASVSQKRLRSSSICQQRTMNLTGSDPPSGKFIFKTKPSPGQIQVPSSLGYQKNQSGVPGCRYILNLRDVQKTCSRDTSEEKNKADALAASAG